MGMCLHLGQNWGKCRKPVKISGIYKEQHLVCHGTPNPTRSEHLQYTRWNKFLEGWNAAAANNSKCVIIADTHLDYE